MTGPMARLALAFLTLSALSCTGSSASFTTRLAGRTRLTRGRLGGQPVTHYYDTGTGLSDGRAVDRADGKPDVVELLRRRHANAHRVRLDSSGAGPSDLRHCYMCEATETPCWYYWPPKRGANPGQPPHHRVCKACQGSLHTDHLDKEEHRASRCGLEYECPDGACGPDGC
jgi:hypothetical protein